MASHNAPRPFDLSSPAGLAAAIAEADGLLTLAEDALTNDKPARSALLCDKAQRLRTRAAKAMPDGSRDRLGLLLDIAFTADATGDQRRCVWAVREAVKCSPDEAVMVDLRDYWECCSWILKGDRAFPGDAVVAAEESRRPAPGQMSFLGDEGGVEHA